MELRPHQTEIIEATRRAIGQGIKRPLIFAPCSFGKTIVAAEIALRAAEKGNKVLFLVHRRLLAIQTKEKFDDYGLHSSIIMAGEETDFTANVMITTVQTYSRRLLLRDPMFNQFFHDAAVIFCDEAHLGISETYKKIYKYYTDKVLIGLTGSPARGDQRGLGEIFSCIVESIGIKELTEKGFLAPVRYYAAEPPDLSGVKITAGDYNKGELQKTMNKVSLVGDVVENWLRLAENRPTIVFSSGVKHSIHLRDQFINAGISAEHLDSRSPHEERLDVLTRFRNGEITVVTNCQLFTEGYDADFVSCIAIARPTKSLPLWIQMAGRGQRIFEGKRDCILLDFGGNIERHGFLEDEIIWSLDGKEKAWTKKKTVKVKKPVQCSVCNLVFEGGNTCPDCGSPVKTFGKKIETEDGELKELNPKSTNRNLTWAEKRMVIAGLEWWCREKGWSRGRSAHLYRSLTGVWPNDYRLKGVGPVKPEGKIYNLIRYTIIKSAKSYQKRAANGY